MGKKILKVFLFLIIGALVWYLFIKPSDYVVRFKADTFPGTINQTLKLWASINDSITQIDDNGSLNKLSYQIEGPSKTYRYNWQFEPVTDSTSKVIVGVKELDLLGSIKNKLTVPFKKNDFTKEAEDRVMQFMTTLKDHTENFTVEVVGEEETPSKYLAYIPEELAQMQKAGGMMKNYNYLTGELIDNEVQLDGMPMVIVNHWDRKNDSISFDFAQPIVRSEKLPIGTEIKYRRLFSKKAIKAIYHGNYITSDRAWYALLDYAKKNNIEVEPTPIEIFYSNPNTGGDELSWKAEIYLPIKENETM